MVVKWGNRDDPFPEGRRSLSRPQGMPGPPTHLINSTLASVTRKLQVLFQLL